jgi:stage V sporulation protein T
MKSTGVVRRIDDLGRIVIPKEIRRNLRIKEGDNLEVFVEGEDIILKKYSMMNKINDL